MCLRFTLNQFRKYKCHFQTLRSNHNLPHFQLPPSHSSTPQPKTPSPHSLAADKPPQSRHPNIFNPPHRHQLPHPLQINTLPTPYSAPTPQNPASPTPPPPPTPPPHRPPRHNHQLKHLNPEPRRLRQKTHTQRPTPRDRTPTRTAARASSAANCGRRRGLRATGRRGRGRRHLDGGAEGEGVGAVEQRRGFACGWRLVRRRAGAVARRWVACGCCRTV